MPQFPPGTKLTAARFAKFEYGAQLSSGTPTTLADSVITEIVFDTVDVDTADGAADVANNRIIVPVSGLWMCWASLNFAGNANGRREVVITVNGAGRIWDSRDIDDLSTVAGRITVAGGAMLSAGDAVTVLGRQTSGGNLDSEAGSIAPRLGIFLLAEI
jgi:hypothetical protein